MKRLLLVGCGNMGGAILKGFLVKAQDVVIDVLDHKNPDVLFQKYSNLHFFQNSTEIVNAPDLMLLAVKPQQIEPLLSALPRHLQKTPLVLSVIAGKKIAFYRPYFSATTSIIRAMPNTPSSIQKGVSVCVSDEGLLISQKRLVEKLLEVVGDVFWVDDERQMDAVTALSGSGPAYLFYLTELLGKVGKELGLDADLSRLLAKKMIIGSAYLLEQSAEDAEELRKKVTSPKGTTEAALDVLMQDNRLETLFYEALKAAQTRSKELALGGKNE